MIVYRWIKEVNKMTTTDIRLIIWNLESEIDSEWDTAWKERNMDQVAVLDIKKGLIRELDRRIRAALNES